jgi:SAM-dependent methyltransferase
MTHPTTHSLARLLAAAGVIVLGRTLTAHHPDPATAAESGFLTLWAGGVLGSLVLCSRATGAVVAASLWCAVAFGLPGAAGTRGALVAAALVAVASWSTWRSLAGEGAVRWGDALGLAFAWQALLRGVELAAGPSTLETVIDLAGPPILLAAAAVHLGRAAELHEAELVAYMRANPRRFDVVISADTLVYFGALEEAMNAAAATLKPGGVLAFTLEAEPVGSEEKFRLHTSGRYTHSGDYARECLEAAGFAVLLIEGGVLRKEAGADVLGHVVLAKMGTFPIS